MHRSFLKTLLLFCSLLAVVGGSLQVFTDGRFPEHAFGEPEGTCEVEIESEPDFEDGLEPVVPSRGVVASADTAALRVVAPLCEATFAVVLEQEAARPPPITTS